MRRLWLIAAMSGLFVSGVLIGSLSTPGARADKPVPAVATEVTPGPGVYQPYSSATPYYFPGRWQVIVAPSPTGTGAVSVLLDLQTGESYILQRAQNAITGYAWVHLERR